LNYLRLTGSKLGLIVNFDAYPKAVVEQWASDVSPFREARVAGVFVNCVGGFRVAGI